MSAADLPSDARRFLERLQARAGAAAVEPSVVVPVDRSVPLVLDAGHFEVMAGRLSRGAILLDLAARGRCAMHLTDGVLDQVALKVIRRQTRTGPAEVAELVRAGVWSQREDGSFEVGGYLDLNRSRAEWMRLREQWRERQARARRRRQVARGRV